MRFVALSDTHCRHHHLNIPQGDVIIHAGDITMRGFRSELLDFLLWFSTLPFRYKIFIGGNHDFCLEKIPPAQLSALIPEGVIYLNDSGVQLEGIHIWGSPVSPWHHNWAFNRHRGAHIRRHWQKIPANTDILITHSPPFGILDQLVSEKNSGDKDLLLTVQTIQPAYHLFGHIHEAYGHTHKGQTHFYNCSLVNEQYEMVNRPIRFDFQAALPRPLEAA